VLIILQPLLILVRKRRVHMAVGKVGVALAAVIVVLGMWLAIRSATVTPPEALIWGVHPKQFMVVPFTAVLLFAGFVGAGVKYRRKPQVHRTMMVLATLAVLSAPISRIDLLNVLYVGTAWERLLGPFVMTMLLSILLVGTRWVMTRSLDRLLAVGVAGLLVLSVGIWQLAPTAAWNHFASLFVP
jgi:presenilin-like A22 family membrane protease